VGEVEEVGSFGVVKLEGSGDGVEYAGGDATERSAFEFGVVLHAHAGERCDLTSPQPRYPPSTGNRHASLLGSELGSP
jgi:hypothetical protein